MRNLSDRLDRKNYTLGIDHDRIYRNSMHIFQNYPLCMDLVTNIWVG